MPPDRSSVASPALVQHCLAQTPRALRAWDFHEIVTCSCAQFEVDYTSCHSTSRKRMVFRNQVTSHVNCSDPPQHSR